MSDLSDEAETMNDLSDDTETVCDLLDEMETTGDFADATETASQFVNRTEITSNLGNDTASPSSFNLMLLPPEIREVIYAYALASTDPVIIRLHYRARQPALLAVSQLVCHEALPIFYSATSFQTSSAVMLGWLSRRDPSRTHKLRELQIVGEGNSARELLNAFRAYVDKLVLAVGGENVLAREAVKFPVRVRWKKGEEHWASSLALDEMKARRPNSKPGSYGASVGTFECEG